jgi:hypothetical protein
VGPFPVGGGDPRLPEGFSDLERVAVRDGHVGGQIGIPVEREPGDGRERIHVAEGATRRAGASRTGASLRRTDAAGVGVTPRLHSDSQCLTFAAAG